MPYIGGVRGYRRTCERVAAEGYSGFTLSSISELETPSMTAPDLLAPEFISDPYPIYRAWRDEHPVKSLRNGELQ